MLDRYRGSEDRRRPSTLVLGSVSEAPDTTPPGVPGNLILTPGDTTIDGTWDVSSGS